MYYLPPGCQLHVSRKGPVHLETRHSSSRVTKATSVCHQTQTPKAHTETKTLRLFIVPSTPRPLIAIHSQSLKTPSGTSLVLGAALLEPLICVGRDKDFSSEMAGRAWKISALVAVLALFVILEFQTVEAQGRRKGPYSRWKFLQSLVNECRTGAARCDVNAYCYDTVSAYRCVCRRGWYGDGFVGAGYSGCQRRKLSTWQVATSIVGSILGALLILCCCLACIRNCMRARSARNNNIAQPGDPAYGYPSQQTYPPQQGVPMYATNTQKVPGPAGVV